MAFITVVLFNSLRIPLIMFPVITFVFIGITFGPAFGTLLTMVLVLYSVFYKVPAEQG